MELPRNKEGGGKETPGFVRLRWSGAVLQSRGAIAGFRGSLLSCMRINWGGAEGVWKLLLSSEGWGRVGGVMGRALLKGKRCEMVFYLHPRAPCFTQGHPRPGWVPASSPKTQGIPI